MDEEDIWLSRKIKHGFLFPQPGVSFTHLSAYFGRFCFIIAATAQYFTASFEDYLAAHVRDMAMNRAKIIASNESIITAVKHRDYKRLATIADKLQSGTDFDYVVIGDTNSIRLYHPNPEKIGYPMQFTKPGALEKGRATLLPVKGPSGWQCALKRPSLMTMAKSLA